MPVITRLRSNWLFLAIIVVGLFLRLVWVNDMEWKYDERWMYNNSEEVAKTGNWLSVGMESSAGIVNPGFSAAIFSAMAYFVHTPTGMDSIVQWINVVSILCFLLFILVKIEKEQRDIWLWGLALASVNPSAVFYSRKIWDPDVFPIFCFLVIWGNAYRNKGWGAFLWGFFGALIGQIQMGGFYYAAGLAIFTIIYDYRNKQPFKLGYWLLGSIIGSIGIIPWVIYLLHYPQPTNVSLSYVVSHGIIFNFYVYWFLDSHGLNTMYILDKAFGEFIKEPYIANHPTYLVAALNIALACTGFYTAKRIWGYLKSLFASIKQKQFLAKLTLNLSSTNFYLLSILLGLGILMTFSGVTIYEHYLVVAFPFMYIFMAKIFQYKKRLLIGIIFAQLILTCSYLIYIHSHNGVRNGQYGETYSLQMNIDKGMDYFNKAQYDSAIHYFFIYYHTDTNDVNALENIGASYQNEQKYSLALHYYNLVLEKDPGNKLTLHNLAIMHVIIGIQDMNNNELDKALGEFQNALIYDSNSVYALGNMGLVYQRKGNIEKAKIYYQRALSEDPGNEVFKKNLQELNEGH